jgi:hypothetical protein
VALLIFLAAAAAAMGDGLIYGDFGKWTEASTVVRQSHISGIVSIELAYLT